MKIEIEPKDMESIAHKLMDLLKPLISSLQREENQRTEETGQNHGVLMDVEGVAEYLGVKVSWVYDKTRKKEIPHARADEYLRFRKSVIDDWRWGGPNTYNEIKDGILEAGFAFIRLRRKRERINVLGEAFKP